jgi:hypothetical protein
MAESVAEKYYNHITRNIEILLVQYLTVRQCASGEVLYTEEPACGDAQAAG